MLGSKGLVWHLTYFAWHVACVICDEHLLSEQTGYVAANDNVYYSLRSDGFLKIEVQPVVGDVDLYVSFSSQRPSYLDYDLKSISCGVDEVYVGRRQSRPIFIAVHATDAQNATYVIRTYRLTHPFPPYDDVTFDDLLEAYQTIEGQTASSAFHPSSQTDFANSQSGNDSLSTFFEVVIWLLKIVFELLA